jgi:hypothetical protein
MGTNEVTVRPSFAERTLFQQDQTELTSRLAARVVFRFLFVYLIIYNFAFPLSITSTFARLFGTGIPLLSKAAEGYEDGWNAVITWVGTHLFHVEITVRPNGSGDTTWNYVQVFCLAVFSLVLTAIWSILDSKRPNYVRLLGFLRVYVRYALATTMIVYGAVKVIKSQFPDPPLDRLLQPFGDASPMGLLWTFMGASTPYNIFSGAGELLGALLLTTRRTTLLGSLVCIGVLGHVVVLNFSYDVPVKLFSLHLFLMAVFLAAPDFKRLADLFLFNRRIEPAPIRPIFRQRWQNIAAISLRTALVAAYLVLWLYNSYETTKLFGSRTPKSPLYGIWNVEEFVVDAQTQPPVVTDGKRWRRVIFDYPKVIAIQLMDDKRQRYLLELDEQQMTLQLSKRDDKEWKASFHYQRPEEDQLELEGTFEGKKMLAKLRRVDASEFLLMNRSFHWINEFPFNR